jgi:ABC-type antimicrobial peptide transport system permease subunit
VNERFARHFWPGEDPLGKVFYWGRQDPEVVAATLGKVRWSEAWDARELSPRRLTVVGVVADVKAELADEAPLTFYQIFLTPDNLLIRTATDPDPMLETMRREVEAVDPNEISVARIRTMEQVVKEQSAESRFRAVLAGAFAGLAALLTSLGLFGVLAYAVGQRTREIGVRISLGARKADVTGMILGTGLKLSGVGLLIGLVVVLSTGRFVSSLLFQVAPTDPLAIGGASLLLFAVALTACYLPVRRAGGVNPMEVLRED